MILLHHEWRWNPARTEQGEKLVWFCFYKSRWGMFRFRKHCDHGNDYGCGWWQIAKYQGQVFRDRSVYEGGSADSLSHSNAKAGGYRYVREPLQ